MDVLNEQKIYDKNNRERAIRAAELGLKALKNMGYVDDPSAKGEKTWFLTEDQTIGLPMIADLVLQGKSKSDIENLMYLQQRSGYHEALDNTPGYFELENASPMAYSFIDECIKIKNKK